MNAEKKASDKNSHTYYWPGTHNRNHPTVYHENSVDFYTRLCNPPEECFACSSVRECNRGCAASGHTARARSADLGRRIQTSNWRSCAQTFANARRIVGILYNPLGHNQGRPIAYIKQMATNRTFTTTQNMETLVCVQHRWPNTHKGPQTNHSPEYRLQTFNQSCRKRLKVHPVSTLESRTAEWCTGTNHIRRCWNSTGHNAYGNWQQQTSAFYLWSSPQPSTKYATYSKIWSDTGGGRTSCFGQSENS